MIRGVRITCISALIVAVMALLWFAGLYPCYTRTVVRQMSWKITPRAPREAAMAQRCVTLTYADSPTHWEHQNSEKLASYLEGQPKSVVDVTFELSFCGNALQSSYRIVSVESLDTRLLEGTGGGSASDAAPGTPSLWQAYE